jgi:uncharacterized protein YjiS (DUF1127 family)
MSNVMTPSTHPRSSARPRLTTGQTTPSPVWSSIERAVILIQTWRQRSKERRALQSLSDHSLKDLGLSSADVDHEARKRFWQE